MMRVTLNPEMLRWARERAQRTVQDLAVQFPKLDRWERGEGGPTLKQVERFSKTVHAPIGYLFLPEPPVESVPIPDTCIGLGIKCMSHSRCLASNGHALSWGRVHEQSNKRNFEGFVEEILYPRAGWGGEFYGLVSIIPQNSK